MAAKLTKPLSRTVVDHHGKPLTVTLTADGILFRRPRARTSFLLPYAAGETRAEILASGSSVGIAVDKPRKNSTKVSRGLLSIG